MSASSNVKQDVQFSLVPGQQATTPTDGGTIRYEVYDSVMDLQPNLWDEKIAQGHPYKSGRFMRVLEESFPERIFAYLVFRTGDRIVAASVLTFEHYDLALMLPKFVAGFVDRIRRFWPHFFTLRLAMVGTLETVKRHWWFDESYLTPERFARELAVAASRVFSSAKLLIIRDFADEPQGISLKPYFQALGFASALNMPLAMIDIDGVTLDEHHKRLRSKPRAALRKMHKAVSEAGLKVERLRDFRAVVDQCYPLYLAVHERATEYKRKAMPLEFFIRVASQLEDVSSFLVVRNADGQIIGFMMSGIADTISNPFVVGFDYRYVQKYSLYYALMWNEIAYATARDCREMDVGLTNYFIKQGLGARLDRLDMVARFQVPVLGRLLTRLIPHILSESQPEQRRQFNTQD